jgi:hypothetical protein
MSTETGPWAEDAAANPGGCNGWVNGPFRINDLRDSVFGPFSLTCFGKFMGKFQSFAKAAKGALEMYEKMQNAEFYDAE